MVLVASTSPSSLALIRGRALPRILARGEAYFRGGAVRLVRVGPGSAIAEVVGSQDAPYEVSLSWSRSEIRAACSCPYDWSEVCKHAVAVAHALEPATASRFTRAVPGVARAQARAGARIEPDDDPACGEAVAEAAAKEREARAKAARTERFQLKKTPRGRYGAYQVKSARAGILYDVLLLSDAFVWCSCPDLRTSELDACKHIEFVRGRARATGGRAPGLAVPTAVAVVAARDTRGRTHDPLGDVRLYLPPAAPAAWRRIAAADGFVDSDALGEATRAGALRKLRRLLDKAGSSVVRPEVWSLLDRLETDEAWAERVRPFTAAVRDGIARRGPVPAEWARLTQALRHELHPYQVDGVLFAVAARRALLGDDMGLGKTFQAIAAARILMELGEVRRAVIVCPASLKHQWAKEIRKFLGDAGPSAAVIEGGRRAREELYRHAHAGFLILNYEVLIKDLPLLRAVAPELVIVDEAQRIKNWNTKTAKSVKALHSPRVLVLTGTPMENRLGELHSVAEHLDPRILGPMWRLQPEFAETRREDKRVKIVGFRGLDLLRRRLAPVFLRRERALVLSQLPERTEKTYTIPFTREQAAAHAEHQATAARIAAKKFLTEADVLRLMAELQSMRMIANGMLLYEWEKVERVVRAGRLPPALCAKYPSPKLAEFAEVLEELLGQRGTKVVVFSQWERMLRLAAAAARPALEQARARPLFFHGQLTSKERAEAIADFHDDPSARVFFSTDAGGVGLNLQEAANALVHLEVPWNPAVLEQRVGRIHRMGQKKPVLVVSLVSEGCIETRIAQVVEQKRALFDGLFRGDSDELRFDDEARGSLVDRMRALLASTGTSATLPDEGLAVLRRPVDEKVREAKHGIAALTTEEPGPGAGGSAPAVDTPEAVATTTAAPSTPPNPAEWHLDLGAVAQGLLGLLAPATTGPRAAPVSLPVSVRRQGGKLTIEWPDVPDAAWQHLEHFVAALGGVERES